MILEKLSNINAAPGNEKAIRELIYNEIKEFVDDYKIDPLGNLHVYQDNKSDKSILITAHMDEVGLIVKKIEENGLIRVAPMGGVNPTILPGTSVTIGENSIPGIAGMKSVHLLSKEARKKNPTYSDVFIDVGATSKKDINDINIGDYVFFDSEFCDNENCYFGKAFDDRVGCSAIIDILKKRYKDINISVVFTVQEEVGLRGGKVASFGKDFIFNLNLEGTISSDREIDNYYTPVTELGEGPVLTFMDKTIITNKKLLKFVQEIATKNGIKYQFKREVAGGTDAGAIHLEGIGHLSVTIATPIRYIHSAWGVLNKKDYENYIELAKKILENAKNFNLGE